MITLRQLIGVLVLLVAVFLVGREMWKQIGWDGVRWVALLVGGSITAILLSVWLLLGG